MKKEKFLIELKGILCAYLDNKKANVINNNIDELIAYWKVGNILDKVNKEMGDIDYDKWYFNEVEPLEASLHYEIGEFELMRELYLTFNFTVSLPVLISWNHLRLILLLDDMKERHFYLSEVENKKLDVLELQKEIDLDMCHKVSERKIEPLFNSLVLFNFNGQKKYKYQEFRNLIMGRIKKRLFEYGFLFVNQNVKFQIEDKHGLIDLIFYYAQIHAYIVVKIVQNGFDFNDILKISCEMSYVNENLKDKIDIDTKGIIIDVSNSKGVISYILE